VTYSDVAEKFGVKQQSLTHLTVIKTITRAWIFILHVEA
jgi:hypothetical protein